MGIAWGLWAIHTHLNTFLSVLKLCHLQCFGCCTQRGTMAAVEPDVSSSQNGGERLGCSTLSLEHVLLTGKAQSLLCPPFHTCAWSTVHSWVLLVQWMNEWGNEWASVFLVWYHLILKQNFWCAKNLQFLLTQSTTETKMWSVTSSVM